jgi:hypothetical protein
MLFISGDYSFFEISTRRNAGVTHVTRTREVYLNGLPVTIQKGENRQEKANN